MVAVHDGVIATPWTADPKADLSKALERFAEALNTDVVRAVIDRSAARVGG